MARFRQAEVAVNGAYQGPHKLWWQEGVKDCRGGCGRGHSTPGNGGPLCLQEVGGDTKLVSIQLAGACIGTGWWGLQAGQARAWWCLVLC